MSLKLGIDGKLLKKYRVGKLYILNCIKSYHSAFLLNPETDLPTGKPCQCWPGPVQVSQHGFVADPCLRLAGIPGASYTDGVLTWRHGVGLGRVERQAPGHLGIGAHDECS